MLLTTNCGRKPSFAAVRMESAVNAGTHEQTTTCAPAALSADSCGSTSVLAGS